MFKKLFIVGALSSGAFCFAQDNIIKANPAALLGGSDLVSFEHRFSDRISGVIGGGIGGYKISGSKYSSAGGGLQFRYYFDEALTGFYAAAVGDYSAGKVKTDYGDLWGNYSVYIEGEDNPTFGGESEQKFTAIGGGLRAGYQWIFDSGFTLDVNLGAQYKTFKYKYDSNLTADQEVMREAGNLKGNGFLPAGSIGIGYAF